MKTTKIELQKKKREPTQTEKQEQMLKEAYETYLTSLTAYALRKTSSQTVSDDLVQDTFTKTWVYLLKHGKIDTMRSFLYHILNHLIIDEYRKNKAVSLDVLCERGFEPSFDSSNQVHDLIDGRLATNLIQQIPEKYHHVMTMRYVEDLSLEEMSAITGESRSTMAVQAHRGLEKLKKIHTLLSK